MSFAFVNMMGQFYVVELMLLVYLFLRFEGDAPARPFESREKILGALCLALLAVTIVQDLFRQTDFIDWSRSWAAYSFLMINYLALRRLLLGSGDVLAFAAGVATSYVISFFVQPTAYAHSLPWKFAFALPVMMYAALAVCLLRGRSAIIGASVLWAYGLLSLALGGRAYAGVAMVSGGLLVVPFAQKHELRGRWSVKPSYIMPVGVVLTLLALIASNTYSSLAESGRLGEKAKAKYEEQLASGGNVVLGGRPEIVYAASAISQSVWAGRGSRAKRESTDDAVAAQWYERLSMPVNLDPSAALTGEIPTHSHLSAAWLQAGVAGAAFWVLVMFEYFSALCRSLIVRTRLTGIVLVLGLLQMWNILFSPFGSDRRIFAAFLLVAAGLVRSETEA